jgi:hypothetical protein
MILATIGTFAATLPPPAIPNQRQLDFMELEFTQFMHFGVPFWDPPAEFLHSPNPTYHDCNTTTIDHSNQTGAYYPCLNPRLFAPTDLDWIDRDTWDHNPGRPGRQ